MAIALEERVGPFCCLLSGSLWLTRLASRATAFQKRIESCIAGLLTEVDEVSGADDECDPHNQAGFFLEFQIAIRQQHEWFAASTHAVCDLQV